MADEHLALEQSNNGRVSSQPNIRHSNASASPSPLRNRPQGKSSPLAEISDRSDHRRSSLFSLNSLDEVRQSLKSSTDDLLLPKINSSELETQIEPSHWHSIPLALALLPAVGGLFFKDGSALVTDVTLLGLAAIFLNWSVRLPWDWYCSAQSIRIHSPTNSSGSYPGNENVILEESNSDESKDGSASPTPQPRSPDESKAADSKISQKQRNASSELQTHELFALFLCFIFPVLGAWVLHAMRSQLSRPREGLVSNYNLTIFLFAAEIRPLRHLVKMVQSRTLHLQRVVNQNPFDENSVNKAGVFNMNMNARLVELEARMASSIAVNGNTSNAHAQISTEVRKSVQPDLEALNRAVRRYEKRATLLAIQTESRIQDLEARMADAITLAAAAERSHANAGRASAFALLNSISTLALLPVRAVWTMLTLPVRAATSAAAVAEAFVEGKVKKELKTAGRAGGGHGRMGSQRTQGRAMKKML